jgi:hypothetical protein
LATPANQSKSHSGDASTHYSVVDALECRCDAAHFPLSVSVLRRWLLDDSMVAPPERFFTCRLGISRVPSSIQGYNLSPELKISCHILFFLRVFSYNICGHVSTSYVPAGQTRHDARPYPGPSILPPVSFSIMTGLESHCVHSKYDHFYAVILSIPEHFSCIDKESFRATTTLTIAKNRR